MQQLELGLGNITVDEFGISVMLLSFISIEKNANRMVRVFSDGINYFLSSFTSSKSASTTSSSFFAEALACAPSPAWASACACA